MSDTTGDAPLPRAAVADDLEVAPGKTGRGRRSTNVAAVLGQDALHVPALELSNDLLSRWYERQVLSHDLIHEVRRPKRHGIAPHHCVCAWWATLDRARDVAELPELDATRHGIAQLPHVAGPGVLLPLRQEAAGQNALVRAKGAAEMTREQRDVLAPRPQRRELDPPDGQPMK